MFIVQLIVLSALSIGHAATPANYYETRRLAKERQDQENIRKLRDFEHEFRQAINKIDLDSLSLMIHYPLVVNSPEGSKLIPNMPAFIDHYMSIVPPDLRRTITRDGFLMNSDTQMTLGDEGEVLISLFKGANQELVPKVSAFNFPANQEGAQLHYFLFACQTREEVIIIDKDLVISECGYNQYYKLRTWTLPNHPPPQRT